MSFRSLCCFHSHTFRSSVELNRTRKKCHFTSEWVSLPTKKGKWIRSAKGSNLDERTSCSYHEEAVSDPKFFPTAGTLWYSHRLTVHSDHASRGLADGASWEVSSDFRRRYRRHRHRHRLCRAQPVAVVVLIRVVAHVLQSTECERHGGEFPETASGRAWKLNHRKSWN